MPSIFKMSTSDEKKTEASEDSAFVIAEVPRSPTVKARSTVKYVTVAVSVIVTIAMVLTALLVGMNMFIQAEQAVIKYTMNIGINGKQHVTSDPNENIVQYHVSSGSGESWIVNDFNRDIQLMKMTGSDGITNCFLAPLNKTEALSPSQITGPESSVVTRTASMRYTHADTPITDISFLSQTAQTMCSGLSVYWMIPQCSDTDAAKNKMSPTNQTSLPSRKKRQSPAGCTTIYGDPYYIQTYIHEYDDADNSTVCIPCFIGCCQVICAWKVSFNSYMSGGGMYCTWDLSGDPSLGLPGAVIDECCQGPTGLSCNSNCTTFGV